MEVMKMMAKSLWDVAKSARRSGRARDAVYVDGPIGHGGGHGRMLRVWMVNGHAAIQRGITSDWDFVPETQARQVRVQDLG
jgi:hypothetical protein